MMARIGNKLIAICSAAIGIIYAAGYVVTESTAADTVQNEIAIALPAPASKPSTQPIQTQQAVPVTPHFTSIPIIIEPTETPDAKPQKLESTPSLTPTSSPQPTPIVQNQKYQDGSYTGSGTNRFGTVEVEVTIEKGKIANVDITSSRTRYPQKYIDPLPAEVVDAQDYNVDTVSGATRSSEDFINAVREALMQAEGNN
jgi:uncharacterized protein with FMN-binding domain